MMLLNITTPDGRSVVVEVQHCEELEAAEKMVADNDRWLREVLEDFKIGYDDHATSMRFSLTYELCRLRNALRAKSETVSERCRREHYQDCSHCEDAGCHDNTNQALRAKGEK
jgi:predicted metal-dependent hydrolase